MAWGPSRSGGLDVAVKGLTRARLAVDLPGHGASARLRGDYSLGSLASSVRDVLDALEVKKATIVDHSLGGGIVG